VDGLPLILIFGRFIQIHFVYLEACLTTGPKPVNILLIPKVATREILKTGKHIQENIVQVPVCQN
jgi:hypothetical protein